MLPRLRAVFVVLIIGIIARNTVDLVVQSTVGSVGKDPSDGSHLIVGRIHCRSAVEKVLAVGNPVAGWGYFISKCWRKRSKCRCTKDQFTNEI